MHILLLGGTTEASSMAKTLAEAQIDAVFSYAGRTKAPMAQPLLQRVGGFGGVAGLNDYLSANNITHVVDATHPFAAQMSMNAFEACKVAKIPLIRLERDPWITERGDNWTNVARLEDAPSALPDVPARVFLAIGKQHIGLFASMPQHHYLLRLIDAPEGPLPLPDTTVIVARGPFAVDQDTALLRDNQITHIVAKNAGGDGARAKIDAARALGIPVILIDRPRLPGDNIAHNVGEVMEWLGHVADRGV